MKRFLLVADLEATCTDINEFPREEMELIQFGAVLIDMKTLHVVEEFDYYIEPIIHTKMTDFCVELTGITDEILEQNAISLGEFCTKIVRRLKKYKHRYEWAAWGHFDKNFIERNLDMRGILHMNPFKDIKYTNLSMTFKEAQGIKRKMGVKRAMRLCGLEFIGRQHNGFDDAFNTSRMLPWILPRRAR